MKSFFDGIGNALGYGLILIFIATLREVLGGGTFLGYQVVPQFFYEIGYVNCGLMILAPGAFFIMGCIVWIQRAITGYSED